MADPSLKQAALGMDGGKKVVAAEVDQNGGEGNNRIDGRKLGTGEEEKEKAAAS